MSDTPLRLTIPVGDGHVAAVVHLPHGRRVVGGVVACHGLGASKESDKYLLLGAELPAAGLALARFDFRGAGESTGAPDDATVASRIDDLTAVLDYLEREPRMPRVRWGLMGSSMGGFIALHVASRRTEPVPVVTWNAPAILRRLLMAAERPDASLGAAFLAELREGALSEAPSAIRYLRVLQADGDEVVPPADARVLFESARQPCDLHVLPGADHRLSDARHRAHAVTLTREWFAEHLR